MKKGGLYPEREGVEDLLKRPCSLRKDKQRRRECTIIRGGTPIAELEAPTRLMKENKYFERKFFAIRHRGKTEKRAFLGRKN